MVFFSHNYNQSPNHNDQELDQEFIMYIDLMAMSKNQVSLVQIFYGQGIKNTDGIFIMLELLCQHSAG